MSKRQRLSLRLAIFDRDGNFCYLCHKHFNNVKDLHVDHVYPVALGGTNSLNNLKTACKNCNLKKGKTPHMNEALKSVMLDPDGEAFYMNIEKMTALPNELLLAVMKMVQIGDPLLPVGIPTKIVAEVSNG